MITHCLFIQLVIQVTYYPIKSIIIPLLLLLSFAKGFLPEVFSASFLPLPSFLWSSTMELVESCTQLISQTSVTCLLFDKCTQTYLCVSISTSFSWISSCKIKAKCLPSSSLLQSHLAFLIHHQYSLSRYLRVWIRDKSTSELVILKCLMKVRAFPIFRSLSMVLFQ